MTTKNRHLIIRTLLVTLSIAAPLLFPLLERYLGTVEAFNECAIQTYKNFGTEINLLNPKIDLLLKNTSEYDGAENKEYVNRYVNSQFSLTRFSFERINKDFTTGQVTNFYDDLTQRLNDITADRQLSKPEYQFLQDLKAFNAEVTKLHSLNLTQMGHYIYKDSFVEKIRESNMVSDAYYKFFLDTDQLLDSEKYSYMKNFEGDYTHFDYEKAEKSCNELYLKLIAGKPLKYNTKEDIYSRTLIFQTMPLDQDFLEGIATNEEQDYILRLYKDTHRIGIYAHFVDSYGKALDPTSLADQAEQLAQKVNQNAQRLIDSPEHSSSDKDQSTFTYTFLINPEGQTEEERNMTIELMRNGEILSIWLPFE